MSKRDKRLDEGTTFFGFLVGLGVGVVVALLYLPARIVQQRRVLSQQLLHPVHPLDESIQQGKQLAREQRD